jgi:hypothetical protein
MPLCLLQGGDGETHQLMLMEPIPPSFQAPSSSSAATTAPSARPPTQVTSGISMTYTELLALPTPAQQTEVLPCFRCFLQRCFICQIPPLCGSRRTAGGVCRRRASFRAVRTELCRGLRLHTRASERMKTVLELFSFGFFWGFVALFLASVFNSSSQVNIHHGISKVLAAHQGAYLYTRYVKILAAKYSLRTRCRSSKLRRCPGRVVCVAPGGHVVGTGSCIHPRVPARAGSEGAAGGNVPMIEEITVKPLEQRKGCTLRSCLLAAICFISALYVMSR